MTARAIAPGFGEALPPKPQRAITAAHYSRTFGTRPRVWQGAATPPNPQRAITAAEVSRPFGAQLGTRTDGMV